MRKWLVLILVPMLLIYRSAYSLFLLPGSHDGEYWLKLYNFHESFYNVIIGLLLMGYIRVNADKVNLVLKIGVVFCYVIAAYMLYVFLPGWFGIHVKWFTIPYYLISLLTGFGLFFYLFFYRKNLA